MFVRIYQHRHYFDPTRKFSTWLFGIARNAALDRVRWRKRHPPDPLDDLAVHPAGNEPAPPDTVARRELEQQIANAIPALPEDQRPAIVSSEYHDLSHAEIADIMKCSEKQFEAEMKEHPQPEAPLPSHEAAPAPAAEASPEPPPAKEKKAAKTPAAKAKARPAPAKKTK